MKQEEWPYTVGAKKNADGSIDMSHAALFRPSEKTSKKETQQEPSPSSEQQELAAKRKSNAETFFKKMENGGGSVEVQEAKLKVKDLTEKLELFREDPRTHDDVETIQWYEREIGLNQRVVNGERLVDVLDSMQTEEDKKRIEKSRERLKNMRQE